MAMICRLQPSSYLTFSTEVWQSCNAWVWILSFLWDMFMLRDVQYQKNSLVQLQQFLFLDPMILNFCLFAQPRRLKAVPPPYNLAPLGRTEQEKSAQFLCLNVFPRKIQRKKQSQRKVFQHILWLSYKATRFTVNDGSVTIGQCSTTGMSFCRAL